MDKFESRLKIYLISLIERRGFDETITHIYGNEREYLKSLQYLTPIQLREEAIRLRQFI